MFWFSLHILSPEQLPKIIKKKKVSGKENVAGKRCHNKEFVHCIFHDKAPIIKKKKNLNSLNKDEEYPKKNIYFSFGGK